MTVKTSTDSDESDADAAFRDDPERLWKFDMPQVGGINNVFPIILGGRVACSRVLAASGQGGEFTQPLPPILWGKRYILYYVLIQENKTC